MSNISTMRAQSLNARAEMPRRPAAALINAVAERTSTTTSVHDQRGAKSRHDRAQPRARLGLRQLRHVATFLDTYPQVPTQSARTEVDDANVPKRRLWELSVDIGAEAPYARRLL